MAGYGRECELLIDAKTALGWSGPYTEGQLSGAAANHTLGQLLLIDLTC